jgi:hypothetical protein
VKGGYWKVPANENFSRTDLDLALNKIAGGQHAWLDVLCIPQISKGEKNEEHSREIGKQGEIFRAAARAAVWLNSGGESVLAEICSWVPEDSHMVTPDVLCVPSRWDMRYGHPGLAEARRRFRLIASLTEQVPWTTSLWTLQEAALRLDAVFYSRGADPILHAQTGNALTVRHLVKTLGYIHMDLTRIAEPSSEKSILHYPAELGASEADIDDWLKAIDAVYRINLHNLMSMNAIQLLLTSGHRTCERPHDRVYGIMGAIGITIPVDYEKDPADVMNEFLVELHNSLPAEMQSFHRVVARLTPHLPSWLSDHDCEELGAIRQQEAPPSRPFNAVTAMGASASAALQVSELIPLSPLGMDELASRLLSQSVLPALDNFAFSQLTDGAILARDCGATGRESYVRACIVLRFAMSKAQLALIPLGRVRGLERLGWSCMYMLVGGRTPSEICSPSRFQRLGVLILAEDLVAGEATRGEFYIY